MTTDLAQHNVEIAENREHWNRKPLLRKVYRQFYTEIAKRVHSGSPGLIVELGSGLGNIKEHLPNCITTDVFPNPWLDRVENAYAMTFADQTVGNLVLFDVWHHLQYPGEALREFSRVLVPGGRIVLFEPAMGLLGKFVFGSFHHEPLGLKDPVQWNSPADFRSDAPRYYAAQGNASRIFDSGEYASELTGWRIAEVAYYTGLAYLGTGGFRGPQLYPEVLLPAFNAIDSILSRFPSLASRMLVVLDKE